MEMTSLSRKRIRLEYTVSIIVFVALSIWFFYIHTLNLDSTGEVRQLWASIYQVMALYGAIIGIFISINWGGYKSLLGRGILLLSLGLLFQVFGQSATSYYIYFANIATPYPSIGDIGFLGSTVCYILSILYLARASGIKFTLKSIKGKIIVVVIPLTMLILSYWIFLKGYEFDWSQPIKIFLDFGYPLGDALYVSIALLTFLLSRNLLGGIMRKPILFLVFALVFQYVSDFTFLYQASQGAWYVGGANDYMYFTSYFLMALSLIVLGHTYQKISNTE